SGPPGGGGAGPQASGPPPGAARGRRAGAAPGGTARPCPAGPPRPPGPPRRGRRGPAAPRPPPAAPTPPPRPPGAATRGARAASSSWSLVGVAALRAESIFLTRECRPNIHSPGEDFVLAAENFAEPARGLAPRHSAVRPGGAGADGGEARISGATRRV